MIVEHEIGGASACTAMNQEIAAKAGNLWGVCPIIGRLRRTLYVAYITDIQYRPYVPCGRYFSVYQNDTHG